MTIKEALISIVEDGISLGAGDYVELEALKVAKIVLEKADKYRWHDLRKDPEDLPKARERVLFLTIQMSDENELRYWSGEYAQNGEFFNDDYEGYITLGSYPLKDIIAWRYIEPFEEE